MTVLGRDLENLTIGAQVELYTFDIRAQYPLASPGLFYFTNTKDAYGADIKFNGITYTAIPIQASGFEQSATGGLPTPQVSLANVNYGMSTLCQQYADFRGCILTRIVTLEDYIDTGKTPNAFAIRSTDVFKIAQKVEESPQIVTFKLLSALDLENVQIPRGTIQANFCIATYRNAESGCPYAGGAVSDYLDAPTANLLLDDCGHRLSSCKMRFGAIETIPYNAFPGAGNNY